MVKKFILFILLFILSGNGQAEVLKISDTTNVQDVWIGAGSDADMNYGGQYYMWAITTGDHFLVKVKNLAILLPANAVITSCVCSLYCYTNTIDASISAYRVFKPWVEGDQTGQTCTGTNATWNNWQCFASAWGTAGVGCAGDDGYDNAQNGTCNVSGRDRKATAEATVNVVTVNTWYGWSISSVLAQGWYDGTIEERGIIFINDGGVGSNRFYSTEYEAPYLPSWTITYTVTGMRVKDDWRFKTSFYDWRFQDKIPTAEIQKIVDNGTIAKILDNGEIWKIFHYWMIEEKEGRIRFKRADVTLHSITP